MSHDTLRREVEALAGEPDPSRDRALPLIAALLEALESGAIRAAEYREGGWRANAWVKQGILLAFRVGRDRDVELPAVFRFRDRDTLLDATPRPLHGVRIVPGGSHVRRGAFVGEGVVIMPPAYVNVGAWVGAGSMVDSHVLVGSCAQIGDRVHLSAAVQIGGVLEPVGALPVIVEDDAFIGGGCGVYEGTRVGAGAVLAPGVVLTRAVAVHDLVRESVHRAVDGGPLTVPEGAVVVPGCRPARGDYAQRMGLQLHAPVIVKYRDSTTAAALDLEEYLR